MTRDEIPPSKTQRKKEMSALQGLGAELVDLNADQLAAMTLPETLRDAIAAAQRITKFEARRRQLQYIGKLMRTVDSEPIREQLDAWKAASRRHTSWLRDVERWRERLLDEENALHELVSSYPAADTQRLRVLIRNALRERIENRPPRSYRALFQALRAVLEEKREP